MSIHNIWDKIKSYPEDRRLTFIYMCVICVVGAGAFGLGRLSVDSKDTVAPVAIVDTQKAIVASMPVIEDPITGTQLTLGGAQRYVASKNGKLYYTATCSGAQRIKAENQVWFSTEADAQKGGYTRSAHCK